MWKSASSFVQRRPLPQQRALVSSFYGRIPEGFGRVWEGSAIQESQGLLFFKFRVLKNIWADTSIGYQFGYLTGIARNPLISQWLSLLTSPGEDGKYILVVVRRRETRSRDQFENASSRIQLEDTVIPVSDTWTWKYMFRLDKYLVLVSTGIRYWYPTW